MDSSLLQMVLDIAHIALPVLAGAVLILCFSALLRRQPPSLGRAELVNAADGEVFPLTTRETAIGSHKSCDLVLTDPAVAGLHAVVVCTKNGWFVSAVGKETAVKVNGAPAETRTFLKTGDQIALGGVTLVFNNR